MDGQLYAGAAITDITPAKSLFLYGYPHVERMSEGVHDPLYASALVMGNGSEKVAICAADIVFITKETTENVRKKVSEASGIKEGNIMLCASHTHSGPMTTDPIYTDPVVPKADRDFIASFTDALARVIIDADRKAAPAEWALSTVDAGAVGGNRRTKGGVRDPEVPVLVTRGKEDGKIFSVWSVYCMHPTVLHEDSKLYSADFPGYTRKQLAEDLGKDCVYLYATGPEGNQSPRHFIESTTFSEAERLGRMLGERISSAVDKLGDGDFRNRISLSVKSEKLDLPRKTFRDVEAADKRLKEVQDHYTRMKKNNESRSEVRTAECDLFGAEEQAQLARKQASGELDALYRRLLPIEVNVLNLDGNAFVFLPGEVFVEYSLRIKEGASKKTFVACLANGVLQGYVVTKEAYEEGGYEASNGLFPPEAGDKMVNAALKLIDMEESNE